MKVAVKKTRGTDIGVNVSQCPDAMDPVTGPGVATASSGVGEGLGAEDGHDDAAACCVGLTEEIGVCEEAVLWATVLQFTRRTAASATDPLVIAFGPTFASARLLCLMFWG